MVNLGFERVVQACRVRRFNAHDLTRQLQRMPDPVVGRQFNPDFTERIVRMVLTSDEKMHTFCDQWVLRCTNESLLWVAMAAEAMGDDFFALFIINEIVKVMQDPETPPVSKQEMRAMLQLPRNQSRAVCYLHIQLGQNHYRLSLSL